VRIDEFLLYELFQKIKFSLYESFVEVEPNIRYLNHFKNP